MPGPDTIREDDLQILLDSIADVYGVDFRDYSPASLRRRIAGIIHSERLGNVSALRDRVLGDTAAFQRFVHGVSVNVTSMFRDPSFHLHFRQTIVPMLATYPFIRIWHAGCSSGEEVYSMAIILHEEGLYSRTRIYATDLDAVSIARAKEAIFPLAQMKEYSVNYGKAGGKYSLSAYYTANDQHALFKSFLKENIVFAQHNLATDGSFNEFHAIVCRNVLIYFKDALRQRVLSLLHDSLITLGTLALGSKESLQFSEIRACYEQLVDGEKLYRKVL